MSITTYDRLKRLFDAAIAAALLIVTAPVQLAVASLVRVRLGTPVLFTQQRPGRHERTFVLIKFRTMLPVDQERGIVADEDRMTKVGAFLRSTSLDELPTLINVLRGDMSLVGPRPLLIKYLDRYNASQRRRHEVRPGITGLAQVSGRNALSWDERLALDVAYVDSRSFVLDLQIMAKTFAKVLQREGISEDGGVTMSEFLGPSGEDVGPGAT